MPSHNITLVAPGTRTSNGVGSAIGGFMDTSSIRAQLDVTAVSGITPNMTVEVQDTLDDTNWNTIHTFAGRMGAGREVINITSLYASRIRARWTITGTDPSFTFSVLVQAK